MVHAMFTDGQLFEHIVTRRIYRFVCLASRESDEECMVVYAPDNGVSINWVRPLSEFKERFKPYQDKEY
jgi:hypothetical protein